MIWIIIFIYCIFKNVEKKITKKTLDTILYTWKFKNHIVIESGTVIISSYRIKEYKINF